MKFIEEMNVIVAPQPKEGSIVPAPAAKKGFGEVGFEAGYCCSQDKLWEAGTPTRTVSAPRDVTNDGAKTGGKPA